MNSGLHMLVVSPATCRTTPDETAVICETALFGVQVPVFRNAAALLAVPPGVSAWVESPYVVCVLSTRGSATEQDQDASLVVERHRMPGSGGRPRACRLQLGPGVTAEVVGPQVVERSLVRIGSAEEKHAVAY